MALPPDKKEEENARHIAAGIRNADDYIIRKIQEDYFVIRQTLAATGYATGAIERFFCDMQAAPKIAEFCKNNNIKLAELSKASHHLQMGTSAISVIFNIYEKCVEIGDKLKVYHGPSENETSVENGNQKGFYQNIIYALSNAETRKAFLASLLPSSIGTVGLVFTLLNVVSHWIAPPSGTMEAVVKGIEDLREFSKLILEKLQTVANDNMNNILREQAKMLSKLKN
ncbi:MAG: hypothetical protein HWD59_05725 [Coxiellaceae bacterium]|nr:MAG: hypothetical protein HWD59_05725 [Coxiellaceae bacterium]